MRSRIAITAVLATGALMSSGGAALGVSALATDLSASSAQYGTPAKQTAEGSGTLAAPAQGTGASRVAGESANAPGPGDTSRVAGEQTAPTVAAQAPRQLESSKAGRLPFTGYAAIPMLLIGLALLCAGVLLRRSTHRGPTQL